MSAALAARRAPDGTLELALAGRWTLASLAAVDAALREAAAAAPARARIDLAAVEAMDAAGAWLVWRTEQALGAAGTAVVTAPGGHAHILSVVRQSGSAPCEERPPERSLAAFFARVGAGTIAAAQHGRELLGFFGLCCVYLARTAARPGSARSTAKASDSWFQSVSSSDRPSSSSPSSRMSPSDSMPSRYSAASRMLRSFAKVRASSNSSPV